MMILTALILALLGLAIPLAAFFYVIRRQDRKKRD